ncbi:MAG: SDR family NAD(P)-dependent oxidoreductase [Thaumarchaeota archaeon]|nr:SDR family NAD(P)-dependent oxidoreductase [Nitrososphaerota archaeon]
MKVLVTGGAGFIGYHLALRLSAKGFDVQIAEDFSRGKTDRLFKEFAKRKNVKVVRIDLTEKSEFSKLEKDVDVVAHLAAINGTKFFYEMPDQVIRVNLESLLNVIEWTVKSRAKKILFASSSETYAGTMDRGECPIPTPEDVPLTIGDMKNPRFSYSISKIAGEAICRYYSEARGIKTVIPRYHNVYGPRMGFEHVIPELIMRMLRREDPFLIKGYSQTRSFCYVDDAAGATVELLSKKSCDGEVVNVGTQEEIAIEALAKKLFAIGGYHPTLKLEEPPKGSVARRCPDTTKISKRLGWRPSVSLDDGLKLTFDWYRDNANVAAKGPT